MGAKTSVAFIILFSVYIYIYIYMFVLSVCVCVFCMFACDCVYMFVLSVCLCVFVRLRVFAFVLSQVKSSHLYLYSAFNSTDCVKALNSIKLEDRVSVMYNNKIKHSIFS